MVKLLDQSHRGCICWTLDGVKKMTGHDTNENRGYNQKGYENNVSMNTGHINRQKAADSIVI